MSAGMITAIEITGETSGNNRSSSTVMMRVTVDGTDADHNEIEHLIDLIGTVREAVTRIVIVVAFITVQDNMTGATTGHTFPSRTPMGVPGIG